MVLRACRGEEEMELWARQHPHSGERECIGKARLSMTECLYDRVPLSKHLLQMTSRLSLTLANGKPKEFLGRFAARRYKAEWQAVAKFKIPEAASCPERVIW